MRDRENPYFSRRRTCAQRRKSVRRTRDGSSSIGRKVGARSISNTAASASFLGRWTPDPDTFSLPHRCERGETPKRKDHPRRTPHQPHGLAFAQGISYSPRPLGFLV